MLLLQGNQLLAHLHVRLLPLLARKHRCILLNALHVLNDTADFERQALHNLLELRGLAAQ